MVEPKCLCDKHLLGEHGEIHKHRHNFVKGHSINGRLKPVVQIEPLSMAVRHDALAVEMITRGMNHKSPYVQPELDRYCDDEKSAKVDIENSLYELSQRCERCRVKINNE